MKSLACVISACCVLLPSAASGQIVAEPQTTVWSEGQLQLQVGELYVRGRSEVTDRGVPPLRADGAVSWIALRYGLSNRIQLSATLPVVATNSTPDGRWGGGLRDIEGQGDVLLRGDAVATTALIAQVGVQVTAGHDGMAWRPSLGLQAFKRADPILQFWGISYTHANDQRLAGFRIASGATFRAQSGIGLRVDDSRTAWLHMTTAYSTAMRVNGSSLQGSDRLECTAGIAMNWVVGSRLDLEWSTTTGLSTDAPNVVLGFTLSYTTLRPRDRRTR